MQQKENRIDHSTLRKTGNIGEDAVCVFLLRHGYEILKRNFTVRGGEIDIIAKKADMIAFVEVKTRKKSSLTSGEEAITEAKKRNIIKTAESYFLKLETPCDCRFDVAVVELDGGRVTRLKYYVSAFDASQK